MPTPTATDAAVHAAVLDEMINSLERSAVGAEEAALAAESAGLSAFFEEYRGTAVENRRKLAALRYARALVEREAGVSRSGDAPAESL